MYFIIGTIDAEFIEKLISSDQKQNITFNDRIFVPDV